MRLVSGPHAHHLDSAAGSHPKPPEVVDAVARALRDLAGNPGRGGTRAAREATAALETVRRDLARFVGVADASRVAFAPSATDALNAALGSLVTTGAVVVIFLLSAALPAETWSGPAPCD